jgi:hypothetical protein
MARTRTFRADRFFFFWFHITCYMIEGRRTKERKKQIRCFIGVLGGRTLLIHSLIEHTKEHAYNVLHWPGCYASGSCYEKGIIKRRNEEYGV